MREDVESTERTIQQTNEQFKKDLKAQKILASSNEKKLRAVKELLWIEKDNFDFLERKTKDLEREIALSEKFLVKMDKLNVKMTSSENEDHLGMTMSPDGITEEFLDSQ